MIPVLKDKAPAPDEILNVIVCNLYNYKVSLKIPCGGSRYSCRNNGLHCVAACGDCRERNVKTVTSAKLQQIILIDLDVTCDTLFDNLFFNH